MKFTTQQQKVIDVRGKNVLVSAAAGSGKTAVLVERIIQMVSDEAHPTDIDRLLVVTFTNAAAASMKERIESALNRQLEKEPDNAHLRRQVTLLHNALITTIDSFCLYLIRNHFNDIGLDPEFRIADEGEMKLLCQETLEELLEEKYAAKEESFLWMSECIGSGSSDKKLEEAILKLYEFSMSSPWPEKWLFSFGKEEVYRDLDEMLKTPWMQFFGKQLEQMIKDSQACLEQALLLSKEEKGPGLYRELLEKNLDQAESLLKLAQAGRLEDFFERINEVTGKEWGLLSRKKDPSVDEEKKEQAKALREQAKEKLKTIKEKFFTSSPQRWPEEVTKASLEARELAEITLAFKKKLDLKKREKNLLDFHDMEHMALQILLKPGKDGTYEPTQTALEYRSYFTEILIDEYQDSNLVQEYLLSAISGEEEGRFNRFMVGDVKQSIYKFRQSRPELFMEKAETYQEEGSECCRIDLSKNFRSRKQVTDSVNEVFSFLMHKELGGIEYDDKASLFPAAEFPQSKKDGQDLYETEFCLAVEDSEKKTDKKELEAALIARKIKEYVGALPVKDKLTGELRPASYKDVVILLRSPSGWDEVFRQVLTENKIPVHVTTRTGYFAAQEVQTVLNFLRILNNPLQDIPLFGVLHSPIGGFTDQDIAVLRALDTTGKYCLFDCLKLSGEKKAKDFLALLEHYRSLAVYLPVHALIQQFLEETDYLYLITALPGGSQRRSNVEMLVAKAESYEKTSYTGLFHFVRYMEQLEKYNVDYGESGSVDEAADVVRIMSIHKSKGLEFPICFVSGLTKKFNRQDTTAPVIMDMDLGLAADDIDPRQRLKKSTVKKAIFAKKLWLDCLGEELRVLYVAMTRAEEKLILTGTCKEEQIDFSKEGPFALSESSSFLDMLLPAWRKAGREVTLFKEADFLSQDIQNALREENRQSRLLLHFGNKEYDLSADEELKEKLHYQYAHESLKELYVKTTVSELKMAAIADPDEENHALFEEEEVIPYLPGFLRQEEEKIAGTTRGSAYHKVLEIFPIERKERASDWTKEEVSSVLKELKESGRLKAEFFEAVSPGKISWFLRSDLAKRMRKAQVSGKLHREQPFVLGLSASRLNSEFPKEETVLIQGIIDLWLEEEDGIILADYKTDVVDAPEELIRRYQVQLDYYEEALQRLTGRKVVEKIIYSFALGKEIRL